MYTVLSIWTWLGVWRERVGVWRGGRWLGFFQINFVYVKQALSIRILFYLCLWTWWGFGGSEGGCEWGLLVFFSFQINSVYVLVNKNNTYSPFSYKNIYPNRNISTRAAQLFWCGTRFWFLCIGLFSGVISLFGWKKENMCKRNKNKITTQQNRWILTYSDN
jgi:hypothetical protein